MSISPRRIAVTAVVAVAVAACAAVGSQTVGAASRPASGYVQAVGTLTLSMQGDVNSLDPALAFDIDSQHVIDQLFVGLTRTVPGGAAAGALATSWDTSNDGLTWTFHMRPEATWSDGVPITALDAKYGIERTLDPRTKAPAAGLLDGVRSVTAVDTTTLRIVLSAPTPWLPDLLTENFVPQPQHAIAAFGATWTAPGHIVTSGPYTLSEHTSSKIALVRNARYYDNAHTALDSVTFATYSVPGAFAAFMRGGLDVTPPHSGVPSNRFPRIRKDPRYVAVPSMSTNYAFFNTLAPNLNDAHVRRILSQAIDRRALAAISQRGDLPLTTSVPSTIPGFSVIRRGAGGVDVRTPAYAKLAAALRKLPARPTRALTLYFTSSAPLAQAIAVMIRTDLARIGVKVRLKSVASGSSLYTLATPPLRRGIDMVLLGWAADYPDAHDFHFMFTCNFGTNTSQWCDRAFQRMLRREHGAADSATRYAIERQGEAMLTGPNGAFPVAPLYQPVDDSLVQPWVHGLVYDATERFDLSKVTVTAH